MLGSTFLYNRGMPHCTCLVLIPNPRGEKEQYTVRARTSRDAARKALEAHPYTVSIDAVITVVADGLGPAELGASEHNARQPTFWHRAGTVLDAYEPVGFPS